MERLDRPSLVGLGLVSPAVLAAQPPTATESIGDVVPGVRTGLQKDHGPPWNLGEPGRDDAAGGAAADHHDRRRRAGSGHGVTSSTAIGGLPAVPASASGIPAMMA